MRLPGRPSAPFPCGSDLRPATVRAPHRAARASGLRLDREPVTRRRYSAAMTRTGVRYRCSACAYESAKWLGRCPECGEWGSLDAAPSGARDPRRADPASQPVPLADVDPLGAPRRPTDVPELDRVLGGGLVAGSLTLLGGGPGMPNSTLALQASAAASEWRTCTVLLSSEA